MKRMYVDLEELASWNNLHLALWKAAKGKRRRLDVRQFLKNCDDNILKLQKQILDGRLSFEKYRVFHIKDPKPREIVAVSFELRVVHHAIMNLIGDNLEKSQIHNSFACLPNRGVHAAVHRVQRGLRSGQWSVKIDIEKYFENIDHSLLKAKLARRFKGKRFLALLDSIINSFQQQAVKGLPIGSLTSQYFANFYLESCDRFIQRLPGTSGYVRYMDDMIWFCGSKAAAKSSLESIIGFLENEKLAVKPKRQIQLTDHGVNYCGYRIQQHQLLLSRRKKSAYGQHLKRWQSKWKTGEISSLELQRGYDAVHAITYPAQSEGYRRSVLARVNVVDA